MSGDRAAGRELCARIDHDLSAVMGPTEAIYVAATDDGHVLLEGVVHSLAHHSAALSATRSVPGVVVVEDLMRILL
jgi:osmotically-inducible protein OsmY